MKNNIMLFTLMLSLTVLFSCNRTETTDFEREEEIEREEFRDYDQSRPLPADDEIEYERDVLGNEELEMSREKPYN
jgi:hypothetical protein